jgi:hypothetical protein
MNENHVREAFCIKYPNLTPPGSPASYTINDEHRFNVSSQFHIWWWHDDLHFLDGRHYDLLVGDEVFLAPRHRALADKVVCAFTPGSYQVQDASNYTRIMTRWEHLYPSTVVPVDIIPVLCEYVSPANIIGEIEIEQEVVSKPDIIVPEYSFRFLDLE